MEYPKIVTVFERDEVTHKVLPGKLKLAEIALPKSWLVTEKVDGCLHYSQTVLTDQGLLPVGRIVNQRLPVLIASYNVESGVVEMKPITHYHKEKRVRPFLAVGVRSRRKGNRPKFVVCTDNHRFFSAGQWVQAADLRAGDSVSHFGDLLTEETRQIILGTLLGDGCIYRPSPQTRGFAFSHSVRQEKYFQFKAGLLRGLFVECLGTRGGFPGSQRNRRGSSRATPAVSELIISICEVSGKKNLTRQWADALLPLGLAILYMDDGSCSFCDTQRPRAKIYLNGVSNREVQRLIGTLARFCISAAIFDYKGPTVVLSADGTERFFSLIYPYVPDCMKYKLPNRYLLSPCVLTRELPCEYQGLLETEVLSVSHKLPARAREVSEYQYDLSVADNFNYFTSGILVHNTNLRIGFGPDTLTYNGRTDEAQLYAPLLAYLMEAMSLERVTAAFDPGTTGVLFGEGYGAKIQKGGGSYRATPGFRLFDVVVYGVDGRPWWLNWASVEDVAKKLGVKTVPVLGVGVEFDVAMQMVRGVSAVAYEDGGPGREREGIVARTEPLLLTRAGHRLMWKLKRRDF